jgi:hypothetical protein
MSRLERAVRILLLFSLLSAWTAAPVNGESYPTDRYIRGQTQLFLSEGGLWDQGNRQEGPEERQRMIIVLEDPPQARRSDGQLTADIQLAFLKQQVLEAGAGTVEDELHGVFNGLVAMLTPAEADQLRWLPGVKDIQVDQLLEVDLDYSLPFLQVPEVWSLVAQDGEALTGRGIKVAVVDTGIDYEHPALGGCFGSGCKVTGGWDFVNNDPFPLDDHGHGTHVAGIIASADTIYRGVAPEATLLAYKACDQSGACYASHIISAINRAVEQEAQIINLSLSGEGKPDSPLSVAVDKAVEQGAIVVVSAGNRGGGEEYLIGSPGNTRAAITVGAADKAGQMVSFSSRGGVWKSYYKPDLAAPGLDIRSTTLNGQFISKSGTSMAAPHVAGAAALLAQLHPDWGPEQIKASLMQTAEPRGADAYDAFSEGAGLVQPLRATLSRLSIEPSYLVHSVGAAGPGYTFSKDITVRNTGNETSSYSLGHVSPQGVEVSFTPGLISLGAGESGEVRVDFTTGEAFPGDRMNLSGYIQLQNTANPQEQYHLSYGLTRYVSVSMEFDERPFVVISLERGAGGYRGSSFPSSLHTTIDLLEPGVYDFIFIYPSQAHFVLRSRVELLESQSFAVSKAEARHRVRLFYEEGGQEHLLEQAQILMLSDTLTFGGEPLYASSRGAITGTVEYYFSDFPAGEYGYNLSALAQLGPGNDYYDFSYSLKSIYEDTDLSLDLASFKPATLPLAARGDQEPYTAVYSMTLNAGSRLTFRQALAEVLPEASFGLHLSPNAEEEGAYSLRRISLCTTSNCYDASLRSTRFYETPYLKAGKEGIEILAVMAEGTHYPSDFVKIGDLQEAPYPLNYYPSFWNGQFANEAYRVKIHYAVSGFDWEMPYLRDWAGSILTEPIDYAIYMEGRLWASGDLPAELASSERKLVGWSKDLPESGGVRIEMVYAEANEAGQSAHKIVAEFDTRLPDPNPPTVQALALCSDEKETSEAGPLVYVYVDDESGVQKVDLSILAEGSASWRWLSGERVNKNIFKVDLSGSGQVAGSPVRLAAEDPAGNRVSQESRLPQEMTACPERLLGEALTAYPIFLPISASMQNRP